MKVQCVDALVEEVEVGLPKQPVPLRKRQRWLGQQEEEVCKPTLLRPEKGNQSHGEIWGVSDLSHDSPDHRKGRKCVNVQVLHMDHAFRHAWACRNASSKMPWGSGTRERYRGSFALRCVANKSSNGEPQHKGVPLPPGGGETTRTL